jgi:hypothetical protein
MPASNFQIRPENSPAGNYRNGRKIPARSTMNVIALFTQKCSGAVVEYLVHNLKVEGSRPSVLKYFAVTLPENSGGAEN